MIEFLIAFLPVLACFLCFLQIGLLFSIRLVAEHAATVAARAAAVIIADENKRYDENDKQQKNQLKIESGKRYDAIYQAALIAVAPYIIDGTIEDLRVYFPPADQPGGPRANNNKTVTYPPMNYQSISKVRVRVEMRVNCKIGLGGPIMCDYPGKQLRLPFTPIGIGGVVSAIAFPYKWVKAEATFPYQGARYDWP